VSELSALRRVGHKGADHIAPGNTAASFDAALAAGVDMIEFDVLPEERDGGGRLLLAHDYTIDLGTAPTLEDGLAHLASSPFEGVELEESGGRYVLTYDPEAGGEEVTRERIFTWRLLLPLGSVVRERRARGLVLDAGRLDVDHLAGSGWGAL